MQSERLSETKERGERSVGSKPNTQTLKGAGEPLRAESLILLTDLREVVSKHTSRRRGFRRLPIDKTLTVGSLLSAAVIKADWNSVVDSDMFAISMDAIWGKSGGTPGEGPLTVGVAHGDYTAAEIEEHLDVIGSWDSGDKILNEQRRRKVRTVGSFPNSVEDEVLNDGRLIKTKLGFVVEIGETLSTWAWNRSAATIATGVLVVIDGGLNARKI